MGAPRQNAAKCYPTLADVLCVFPQCSVQQLPSWASKLEEKENVSFYFFYNDLFARSLLRGYADLFRATRKRWQECCFEVPRIFCLCVLASHFCPSSDHDADPRFLKGGAIGDIAKLGSPRI